MLFANYELIGLTYILGDVVNSAQGTVMTSCTKRYSERVYLKCLYISTSSSAH